MHPTVLEISTYPKNTFKFDGRPYEMILFHTCEDPLFPEIGGTSIFLSKAYHRALESAPPKKMQFLYVRIECAGELVGMLCFQLSDLNLGESLKNQVDGSLQSRIRHSIASRIHLKVLCLGNTLVTGDYGFCFMENVPPKLMTILMMEAIEWMLTLKEFKKTGLVFVKDFYENIFSEIPDSPHCRKYHAIDTQPSMILNIDPQWKSLGGYLEAVKSKYRVRANKALQKASHLQLVELTAEEIENIEDFLNELYLKVVDDVGFNLFILPVGYFTALKKELGDKFHLWVHKDKDEIISFFTVFEDGDILDAHFLGYDPEVNHSYKLYLNMLLSMIDHAASRGFRQLQLSRTASEIKSSVGASGVPMWAYLRFPNPVLNSLLPWVYSFFKPDLSWVPRNPFHERGGG